MFLQKQGEYYWYQNDHLGTPQKLIDIQGTIVWSARYSAFGEAHIQIDTIVNHLRFPGQYYDEETGLYYNYHRYYDPKVGRYTRVDPIGFEGGDVNLYGYVGNNSINWIDPQALVTLPNHFPPGWTEEWRYDWGSRGYSGKHWWDPNGGEWRWHPPDKYHPQGHWDYNSWDSWNSPWRNISGNPPPSPAPKPKSWWERLPACIPDPFPVIIHPCIFEPWHQWCPPNPYNTSPNG